MQLDRNIPPTGYGKYTVINNRKLDCQPTTVDALIAALQRCPEAVEFGNVESHFVLKLNDLHTAPALRAYAQSAAAYDIQYANEVSDLAEYARMRPHRRQPD